MTRITNEVLAERIKNMHSSINEKIDGIQKSVDGIHREVKVNTEFRLRFKGVIATISGIAATLAAGIVLFVDKLIGK